MVDNRSTYESSDAVREFAKLSDLQAPERAILDLVAPSLPRARMLDLGVGGGRTTAHFAPRVADYVGADYAMAMAAAAHARFADARYRFSVADARALPFPDDAFDFVLFSFNGIDYVSHDDRQRVLAEVHRVMRAGGCFAFSTHNIDNAPSLLSWMPRIGVRTTLRRWKLRRMNPPLREIRSRDWIVLQDGALHGGLQTYYVRRDEQLRQLEAAGFRNVRVFQLDGAPARDGATDPWLYYLCVRS
ncbi:MAG: class I SAM-dependent methyltransferase [Thermoanaerobaculia bacterium]